MKIFLWTACILLIGNAQGYNFGDIIQFSDHYGLALGQSEEGEKFFHQTENGCEIGTIRPNTRLIHRKDNYQDDDISTNLNEINKRLEQCLKYLSNQAGTPCCGQFDFVNNNCEHTVTYIRYGMEGRVSCLAWFKADPSKKHLGNLLYFYDKNGNERPPRSTQPPRQCRNWTTLTKSSLF